MAATTTKRRQRSLPKPGTYLRSEKELFCVTYALDDDIQLEDCRTLKRVWMKRWDFDRCALKVLER